MMQLLIKKNNFTNGKAGLKLRVRSQKRFHKEFKVKRLKIPHIFFIVLCLFFVTRCKNDNEIMASFQGGAIKRHELRFLFKIFKGDDAEKAATIKAQDKVLRSYAIMKIAALEAEKQKLKESDEYKKRIVFLKRRINLEAYSRYLEASKAAAKFKMMEMQHLHLKNKPPIVLKGSAPTAPMSRLQEAQDLLLKLNAPGTSDEQIIAIISEKTEPDSSKPTGGFQIPVCISCGNNHSKELTAPLMKTPLKKFIHVPNVMGGHWLIRKIGEKTIDADDLTDYFADFLRKQAMVAKKYIARIKDEKRKKTYKARYSLNSDQINKRAERRSRFIARSEKKNLFRNRINKLKKTKKFVQYPKGMIRQKELKRQNYKSDTPLYSLAGKVFTYGELEKEAPSETFSLQQQLQLLNFMVISSLLKDEPDFKKSRETEVYKKIKLFRITEAMGTIYFMKNKPDSKVTSKQVRQWYDLRKHTQFKGKTLRRVKKTIERQLKANVRRTAMKKLQNDLAKKYKLKINRELIKANKL